MASGTTSGGFFWSGYDEVRRNWGWFIALGICLIILGTVAVIHAVLATIVSVIFIGALLVAAGTLEAGHAFWRSQWGGFFVDLVMGVLYFLAGILLVVNPLAGAATLTLLIAIYFFVAGIFRIVAAIATRHRHWAWLLLSGAIDVLLAVMIWQQWPLAGLWVIGLFLGIDLLFTGWSVVMLGLMARNALRTA